MLSFKNRWISIFLALAAVRFTFFSTQESYAESAGKVILVHGKVLIRNEDHESEGSLLKAGSEINEGDVVNTASDSDAKLLMSDKTVLDLGPSTLFKVREYQLKQGSNRQVGLDMAYGKIRAAVNLPVGAKGKFTVRTHTATMGVRGTEFIIASDFATSFAPKNDANDSNSKFNSPTQETVKLTVVHGVVEVKTAAGQNVGVTSGQQLSQKTEVQYDHASSSPETNNAPAKIETLSKQEVVAEAQQARVPDTTFKQAVAVDPGSSGISTLAGYADSMRTAPGLTAQPWQLNTPGTFGLDPSSGLAPSASQLQGLPVKVHVTVSFKN